MSEASLFFVALGIAFMMAALSSAGVHPNLLAAVRTTAVIVLGWSMASAAKTTWTLDDLSVHVRLMLALSFVAVVVSWCLYFRGRRTLNPSVGSMVDRINVGFAAVFALLLVTGGIASVPTVLLIMGGAVILASNRR
jgi:uncharacterized membrane protein